MDEPSPESDAAPRAVAGHLRNLIVTRQVQAGDRVRVESLAQELHVSATPVREALHTLQAEGFLDYQRNRGFVVARLSGDDIRDVFVSIGLLSGELAARVAVRASAEDLQIIKGIHEDLRTADRFDQRDNVSELVRRFYAELHRLGGSPKIVSLVLTLDSYTPEGIFDTMPSWLTTTLRYNDLLLAAFDAREPDAARAAVRGHLKEAGELISTRFESFLTAPSPAEHDVATHALSIESAH